MESVTIVNYEKYYVVFDDVLTKEFWLGRSVDEWCIEVVTFDKKGRKLRTHQEFTKKMSAALNRIDELAYLEAGFYPPAQRSNHFISFPKV